MAGREDDPSKFPTGDNMIADMFGVSEKDREEWAKRREKRAQERAQRGGMVKSGVQAAFRMAEIGITSQMRAAYIEEARGTQEKVVEHTEVRTKARNVDPELENMEKPVDTSGYEF